MQASQKVYALCDVALLDVWSMLNEVNGICMYVLECKTTLSQSVETAFKAIYDWLRMLLVCCSVHMYTYGLALIAFGL